MKPRPQGIHSLFFFKYMYIIIQMKMGKTEKSEIDMSNR